LARYQVILGVAYFAILGGVAAIVGDDLISWRAAAVSILIAVGVCCAGMLVKWLKVSRRYGVYSPGLLVIYLALFALPGGVLLGIVQLFPACAIAALVQKAAGGAGVIMHALAGGIVGAVFASVTAWGLSKQHRAPGGRPGRPA
jgi:hypothetical protein